MSNLDISVLMFGSAFLAFLIWPAPARSSIIVDGRCAGAQREGFWQPQDHTGARLDLLYRFEAGFLRAWCQRKQA